MGSPNALPTIDGANLRWLDAAAVGTLLGYDPRIVCERIACRPDFPRAYRIDGKGHCAGAPMRSPNWMEQWEASPTGGAHAHANRAAGTGRLCLARFLASVTRSDRVGWLRMPSSGPSAVAARAGGQSCSVQ
jgi:hypothetical protein